MNFNRLDNDIEFVNQIGHTLSLEEMTKLKIGLSKIMDDEIYDEILFWGRINTKKDNYYIALGLVFKENYEFPSKQFFYSNTDFEFKILPKLLPEINNYIEELRNLLEGNPEFIIYQKNEEEDEKPKDEEEKVEERDPLIDSEDEENNKPIIIEKVIELDRLSYIVRSIDNDGAILPLGSLKLIPNHELRYNNSFKGLTFEESKDLNNWIYFRQPQQQDKIDLINQENSIFINNFLDNISLTRPRETWVIHNDFTNRNITVRNLLWEGMIGYHKINSKIFGFCYFGNGLKNQNLPFMIN